MKRFPVVVIYLIALMVGYCLVAMSGCAREPVDRKEEIFANTVADIVGVAVPLNEGLDLIPGDSRLYTEDRFGLFVLNHTDHDLVFKDHIFGVRGFAFNEDESRWEEIDLGYVSFDSGPRRLRSGTTEVEEIVASFYPREVDLGGYSEIRLLVIGYAEDTPIWKAYGAYVDVEVVEGPNPNPSMSSLLSHS